MNIVKFKILKSIDHDNSPPNRLRAHIIRSYLYRYHVSYRGHHCDLEVTT